MVDTSTYHYRSRRTGQADLEQRIREICQTRIRYGYRRVHVLLRREGWSINQKRTRRVYRQLGLQLRNKTPKRRVRAKLREDRKVATRPNETWAMDFVHDQWRLVESSGCSRSLTHSHASRRRWKRGSPSAALMSWRCSTEFDEEDAYRESSVSTRALSSCHAT
jgi:putative transposase